MLSWFEHVERMDARKLTKEASMEETVGKGRPRWTYADQIGNVLEKGQFRSILNQQACIKNMIKQINLSSIIIIHVRFLNIDVINRF